MLCISANENRILDVGKVYNLSKDEAEELENAIPQAGIIVSNDTPTVRIPPTPDPEDIPEPDHDEED